MSEPTPTVQIDASGVAEAIADLACELTSELTFPDGVIVIPVASLPAGSVVSLTITVGTPPAVFTPAEPAPEPRRRPMMGTGAR